MGSGSFCKKGVEIPRSVRQPRDNRGKRFGKDVTLCLSDNDANGSFDHAFFDRALWPDDQKLFEIGPVSYAVKQTAVIDGAELRVTYEKGAALQGPILSMTSNLYNGQFAFAEARIGNNPDSAPSTKGERGLGSEFPKSFDYGDARITVLGLDRATRALTYRIDRGF